MNHRLRNAAARTVGALALGIVLQIPGAAWAGFGGSAPSAPALRGPSSVSTSQPFRIQFYYPKGHIKSYYIQFFHCPATSHVRPSNDTHTDPFPTDGCDVPKRPIKSDISSDTGEVTLYVKQGVIQQHEYGQFGNAAQDAQKWVQGNWFVRVRLVSLAGIRGPWSNWHHTLVGSGRVSRFNRPKGLRADRGGASARLAMRGLQPPVVKAPAVHAIERGDSFNLVLALPSHHDYGKWGCCDFQVERAKMVTKDNLAYLNKHNGFPAPGPRKPWTEHSSYLGSISNEAGAQWQNVVATGPLRPHSPEFSYRYWFRVREVYDPNGYPNTAESTYGPWSKWHSFVVSNPLPTRASPGTIRKKTGPIHMQPNGGAQQQGSQSQRRSLPAVQGRHLTMPTRQ